MIFVGNPTGMRSALSFSSRVLSRTSLKLNNASMASSSSSVLTGSAAATEGSSTFDGSLFCTRSGRVSSIWPVGTPVKSVAVTFLASEVDGTTGNVVVDVARSPLFVFFGSGDTVRFCAATLVAEGALRGLWVIFFLFLGIVSNSFSYPSLRVR